MPEQTNNKMLWGIVVILVVLGALYFGMQKKIVAPAEDMAGPIKIGAIAPLSGDAAAYGVPDQRAKELALKEINDAGGVNGRPIEIIWEDTKCNGTDATTATQKLLNIDKVNIILGDSCSGATLAAVALTQPARALLFSALSSSPDITKAGDLVFRTWVSDALQGKVMSIYAVKTLKASRAAVISEKTDYSQALRKVFAENFAQNPGTKLVFDETFDTGETDFRTQMTKIKASNPDIIYLIAQSPATGNLVLKQMREAGLRGNTAISDSLFSREEIKKNPALYEGILSVGVQLDEKNEKTAGFFKAYKDTYNVEPEFPGYLSASYDSMYLLVEAMEKTGSTEPEKIAEYFNTQVKDWQGALGTFNFDKDGDAILQVAVRKIVKGAVTDLGPVKLE